VNNSNQMLDLRNWSFARVLLASAVWILLNVGLAAAYLAYLYTQFRRQSQSSGSGGIGAVSFGIGPFAVLVPFGPPIVLTVIWLFLRRS
jgi:hypothetical protein